MARKNDPAGGCLGLGCLGFGVLFLGFCGSLFDGSSSSYSPPEATSTYDTPPAAPSTPAETFYVHGELNVRTGPGKNYPAVRTLARGESVRLGPKDAGGWAELFSYGGTREGYVYRASDLVRSAPPPARSAQRSTPRQARSTTGRSSAASRGYYTGPRGGCYTYSSSGRKRYVDRSYCR